MKRRKRGKTTDPFTRRQWLQLPWMTALMKHNDEIMTINFDLSEQNLVQSPLWMIVNLLKSVSKHWWLKLTQDLEPASSKVLVYLPDGGDCSTKEECLARSFYRPTSFLLIQNSFHSLSTSSFHFTSNTFALRAFDLCHKAKAPSVFPITANFFSFPSTLNLHVNPAFILNRCTAGSEAEAYCTGSRQEVIEREGGIWGSNPDKNPFHDYFKVTSW